jgi:hypothetical protein
MRVVLGELGDLKWRCPLGRVLLGFELRYDLIVVKLRD